MTSPSRRKHPTTRRNSRKNSAGAACGLALIAAVATLLSFTPEAAAEELQWRRGRTPTTKAPTKATAQESPAHSQNTNQLRRDAAVRPAAFEDDGNALQLTDASAGRATLRSVVVNRNDDFESLRSAQLPTSDATDTSIQTDTNAPPNGASQFEEQIRTPFGEVPEDQPPTDQPPAEEPQIDEELQIEGLDLPDDPMTQPGATERAPTDLDLQQPFQPQPPQTFQQPPDDDRLPVDGGVQPPDDDRLPLVPGGAPLPLPATDEETLAEENREMQETCTRELTNLRDSTLSDVDLTIVVRGTEGLDYPYECSIEDGTWHPGRCWDETTYLWKASALCHKPLYFEDESLERYGHSWGPCIDPLVSGAHFFTKLPILPYCMGVEPPNECIYALGHYRPGSCAPYMIHAVPISGRGALFQAGAVTGAAFVLP